MDAIKALEGLANLSPWEAEFRSSITDRVQKFRKPLTEKQIACAWRIVEKRKQQQGPSNGGQRWDPR
jgi:hypothetical protein